MRTKIFIFAAFLLMQVNEIFKYFPGEYSYPVKGWKASGAQYEFTFPLEMAIWFFTMAAVPGVLIWRLCEIEGDRGIKTIFAGTVLWFADAVISANKPYGYIWLPNWAGIPYIPVSADMGICLLILGIIIWEKVHKEWSG